MRSAHPPLPLTPVRDARRAVAVVFVMHGVLTGGWVPHIPLAKEGLEVGTGAFGWILLAMAGGGIAAMPMAGALINRTGSATVVRASGLVFCLSFALPVYAPSALALVLALALFGAAIGTLDVAMNAHGLAVEQQLGRAVMSSFHGWYSVGAAAGAGLGGLIVGAFGATVHVIATVIVSAALLVYVSRRLLPPSVDRGLSGSHFAWPTGATLTLGALCFLALFIEGAVLDWSGLHLRQSLGATIEVAAAGFAAFSMGMAVSRFAGDAWRMRFGAVRLILVSAATLALALAAALVLPEPALVVAAFAVAGLGVGNITPVLFAGGGRAEPDAPGRGIAAVTTMGYSGFLIGPPFIGMVAEWVGLRAALALTVAAALVIAAAARAGRAADGAAGGR
jgi:MFS family permease